MKEKEIVINNCYGGFSLSPLAIKEWAKLKNKKYESINIWDSKIPRDDKDLIAVVKKLGTEKASGKCAELKIVKIPADVDWEIEEYDGVEWVSEKHRTWK